MLVLCCALLCLCLCLLGWSVGKSSSPPLPLSLPLPLPLASANSCGRVRSFDYAVTERAAGFQEVACSTLVIWETFAHSAIRFWSPVGYSRLASVTSSPLDLSAHIQSSCLRKHNPDFAEKSFSVPSHLLGSGLSVSLKLLGGSNLTLAT